MTHYKFNEVSDKEALGVNVSFTDKIGEELVADLGLGKGFNEYGVRENEDGSIDVIFRAMEPGVRKGFKVTEDFLRGVASKEYGRLPFQMDHSKAQRKNVGYVDGDNVWFRNGALGLVGHIPDTGNSVRSDVIADFTHEPPAIQNGSVSFDHRTVELDFPDDPEDPVELLDAELSEFSLTPFPGGYDRDSGGLSAAFSDLRSESEKGRQRYSVSRKPYTIIER